LRHFIFAEEMRKNGMCCRIYFIAIFLSDVCLCEQGISIHAPKAKANKANVVMVILA
jgi:hypothetical protein